MSNYLKIVFAIIKAHVKEKRYWKMFFNYFCWSCHLNSLFHNLTKKSFFHDVSLRLPWFPTNSQYSIICQSNFVFIQHSIISEKHFPFYILAVLEVNKIFLKNYYPSKIPYHSKRNLYLSLGPRFFKALRIKKKIIKSSSKRIPIAQLVLFPLSPQSY